jgi:site-specific DNA-adenine methylase
MTKDNELRPFFSFYGGKWRGAPRYPTPLYPTIIEPFAGSAGYSVRYAAKDVRLFDVDEKVIGTWQYLIRAPAAEIERLPLLGPGDHVDDFSIAQEARWLIGWWLNKGMTAPCYIPSQWMRNPLPGRLLTYWGAGVRAQLARQVEHIRHWSASVASYDSIDLGAATWFVDPPYVGTPGGRYRFSNRGLDYVDLADWCQGRLGQTIVCENTGADWLPFEHLHDAKAARGVSREAIWVGDDLL